MVGLTQSPDETTLRREAEENYAKQNWRDAFNAYQQLCLNRQTSADKVASDLSKALECSRLLNRTDDIDRLLLDSTNAHSDNWSLLQIAARSLRYAPHYGIVADQKFFRAPTRNITGSWISCSDQDRRQSLIWYSQAMKLALQAVDAKKATQTEVAPLYLEFAEEILEYRNGRQAWLLQEKSDLEKAPDYLDFEAPNSGVSRFAPVDKEGKPIFYATPASWEEAANDGERFRWLIEQTVEADAVAGLQARLLWADFLNGQFSVDTLQQDTWLLRPFFDGAKEDNKDIKDEKTGVFQIHTLADNETIARLAGGIQRFTLDDIYNPIKIYQELSTKRDTGFDLQGLQRLVAIYSNRRQYTKAADTLKRLLELDPKNQTYRDQLGNIVDPRGQFDPQRTQLAGQGATLSLLFRNATEANFSANEVDIEKLFADTKKFFKNPNSIQMPSFGGIEGMYPPSLQNPAELFQKLALDKNYLRGEVANWTLKLEPRENHWDRRIDISTPLQKPGLYLVTVKLDDNQHTARTFVWIQDTAIIRKPLSEKQLYVVADAKTGASITDSTVEFFGFNQFYDPNGKAPPKFITKNFARKTNAQGQVVLDSNDLKDSERNIGNLQWIAVARTPDKRLALLGVEGLWAQPFYDQPFSQRKAYGVSDRPIYRPGDTAHTKFWIATASYDPSIMTQPLVGQTFQVQMRDGQGKMVAEKTLKTDRFGGAEVDFEIPKTASLGRYFFQVVGVNQEFTQTELSIRVEEYRKPEFEVKIDAPQEPIQLGDKFNAKIEAKYYFGTPVAGAKAQVRVERTAFSDTFYPVAPYDWCYGPGYWWFGYDYPWYPGWSRWVGCRSPHPWWLPHFQSEPPELVLEQEITLDEQGRGDISIDSSIAKAMLGTMDHRYNITVEVRDASRRTLVSTGEVIAAREAFKIYSWLHRGFYRVGDKIEANFLTRTLGGKPVSGKGRLSLLRIQYDDKREPIETVVDQWDVATNEEGKLTFPLEAKRSGQYRLKLELTDSAEHTVEGAYLFTIRGDQEQGSDYRFSGLELIPDKQQYKPGEKVQLQINADRDDATVLLFVRPSNSVYPAPQIIKLTSKSRTVEIPVKVEDQPNFFVEAITVYGGEVHQATREIIVPPEQRVLDVKVVSNKAEYLPGEEAEVEVSVTDPAGEPVEGSAILAVYDRSLEALAADSMPRDIREFFWKYRRNHYPQTSENLSWVTFPMMIERIPGLSPIGIFGDTLADDADQFENKNQVPEKMSSMRRKGGPGIGMMGGMPGGSPMAGARAMAPAAEMGMMAMADAAPASGAPGDPGGGGGAQGAPTGNLTPKVRQDFADSAYWIGNVVADETGKAKLRFKMPENLTSWSLRSWAVGSGVRVGSASTTALTRKNLLVRLQMPRFLVERDEVVISALVNNDLNEAKDVKVRLEIDGQTQLDLIDASTLEQIVRVESHGQARVDWRCKAIAEGEATLRTLALTDVESDAMQLKIPVVVNGILKQESFAGTVRGEQASSSIKLNVPEARRADQSRLTVRVSPSLAAAMVDALPYMSDYPYGCTEQTLNRFLPSVITQRMLQQMNLNLADIAKKRNNLNAQELGDPNQRREQWKRLDRNPVFDEAELSAMVAAGVGKLTDMQNGDGGWGWFSGTGETSWPHTTAVVVRGLLVARDNDVAIVPDVIERGLQWLERYQAQELLELKNAPSKTDPYKTKPDNTDALVFYVLAMSGRINGEMQQILVDEREVLSVYSKSMLALATHKAGNQQQTDLLRQNIEQFLEVDAENETAFLRDDTPWWYWYGSEIESMAMYLKLLSQVDPQGATAPRLVKYLLNQRKNSTYWNSTRDTALVVEAFGDYLKSTGELSAEITAEIWMDGKRLGTVAFTKDNLFDVNNTIEIVGNAITTGEHNLEIRRTEGKGSLYWNAYLTQFTQEEKIAAAGLEVKVERRFYRQDRITKDLSLAGDRGNLVEAERTALNRLSLKDLEDLPSGTLVEVELLIESKNDYEYLLLEDRKPAGLEAVDTQSGYFYSGGLPVYRELRDQKTAFFIRQLPRGKHSLRYQLRAEAPGVFTALPAQISGMYAPELAGNSNDFDLKVIE